MFLSMGVDLKSLILKIGAGQQSYHVHIQKVGLYPVALLFNIWKDMKRHALRQQMTHMMRVC